MQQTGFKGHALGTALHAGVVLSAVFIHFCLIILTVSYYNDDNDCGGWTLEPNIDQAISL